MGVRFLDEWLDKERLVKHGPVDYLKGTVIGVDAAFFARQFLVEPLLTALGGAPIALEGFINAIKNLQAAGVELHFVFDGLRYCKQDSFFAAANSTSSRNATAFSQYEDQQPEHARRSFQALAGPILDQHMDTLKGVLFELGVPFTVAPYSALAQLACFEKQPKQFIDAIYGPTEIFYFGVDKVIVEIADLNPQDPSEKVFITDPSIDKGKLQICWVDANVCMRALGGIPPHIFTEALILAGSDLFLSTYPPLLEKLGNGMGPHPNIIREAVNVVAGERGNLLRPLEPYDASTRETWFSDYQHAMTIIKYPVIITENGDVETPQRDQAPNNTHDCIGLRLPEELFMYLSRGVIGTRVLNYIARNEVVIPAPLAGAGNSRYRSFTASQIDVIRKQAICLLTEGLFRNYQKTPFHTHPWFDRDSEVKFKTEDVNPSPRSFVSKWNVHRELLDQASTAGSKPGSFNFALGSLADAEFASCTVTPRNKSHRPLESKEEVLANSTWRFLQLRNFIDESHQLTAWGKILQKALGSVTRNEIVEAVFLAVEMLRLGVLDTYSTEPDVSGSPERGTAYDKEACTLVSRVASLGRLRHKMKGYSGPLSRSLLAYHAHVSDLHCCLRDLLECSMISSFLEGGTKRDRDDWMELSTSLPFHNLPSCSLGIAVQSYLDNLEIQGDPTMQATRDQTKMEAQGWIQHSQFDASLDDAFQIWDIVFAAVQDSGTLVQKQDKWQEVNKWLAQRR